MSGYPSSYGADLKRQWSIPALQVRFHKGGRFYMPLTRFPAALCDPNGYLLIPDRAAYQAAGRLGIGARLNVRGRVSDLPGYCRVVAPPR